MYMNMCEWWACVCLDNVVLVDSFCSLYAFDDLYKQGISLTLTLCFPLFPTIYEDHRHRCKETTPDRGCTIQWLPNDHQHLIVPLLLLIGAKRHRQLVSFRWFVRSPRLMPSHKNIFACSQSQKNVGSFMFAWMCSQMYPNVCAGV